MTSVDSNFNFLCGLPHGAGPPPPPSTSVHLSLTPSPLRVDVINGWPLCVCGLPCAFRPTRLHIMEQMHISYIVFFCVPHSTCMFVFHKINYARLLALW